MIDRLRHLRLGGRALALLSAGLALFLLAVLLLAVWLAREQGPSTPQSSPTPMLEALSPAGSTPTLVPSPQTGPAPSPSPAMTVITHVVSINETLTSIAALYGVTVESIESANNLASGAFIQVNQPLFIPVAEERTLRHQVGFGETLSSIASRYGISPDLLQRANNLSNPDAVFNGQTLMIVLPEGLTLPTSTPAPTATLPPLVSTEGATLEAAPQIDWPRSILQGDLAAGYPLSYSTPRFTIHYQPGSFAARDIDAAAILLTEALGRAESALDVLLDGKFDIYLAGTLYESPNPHLRGFANSEGRQVYLLYDGTAQPAENLYFFTHEIAHLVSWNTWGRPTSTMLSEGLATYAGQSALEEAGFTPFEQLCAQASQADALPSVTAINRDFQQFRGHIRSRFSYFGSACFVAYLIDTYGIERMAQLYPNSAYIDLYGQSLAALETEWRAHLAAQGFSPDEQLLPYTEEVAVAFAYVFGSYDGDERVHLGYLAADRARTALWRADYDSARYWLDQMYSVTGFDPGG